MCRIYHPPIIAATIGLVAFLGASALHAQALTFTLESNSTVSFQWPGNPDLVLQRSSGLQSDDWETLLASRGLREFTEARREDDTVFYRLVRLPEPGNTGTSIEALEWRVTEMNVHQIQRAVDAIATRDASIGETPPDDGDAEHSFDLFGELKPYAWATQPGLIRVYTPADSGFEKAFKLYSSKDSVASTSKELASDVDRIRNWKDSPNQFIDLNEPETLEDGSLNYPIIDPRALGAGVEGFEYPIDAQLGSVANEVLPMPAEWLYVLKDGSLGTLQGDGQWAGEGEATTDNPIVARMAYWADDETTKLNVNIASEGIPWDVPRADTPVERGYALNQPVKGEIQRYPGHPAMTSLSSVLYPGKAPNHSDESKRLTEDELRTIYALTPRSVFREGRVSEILTFDDDPLHHSTEEWASKAKARGLAHTDYLQGFVTTNNPSPEITIHGVPRMSMWPCSFGSGRSAYDRRSLFLTATTDRVYHYLTRSTRTRNGDFFGTGSLGSPDIGNVSTSNMSLFKMIMNQTYLATPGYGKSLASKYGAQRFSEDYEDDKDYDKDHYSIALSMFDRIRMTNILASDSDPSASGFGTGGAFNLISRDLQSESPFEKQLANWHKPTLEPQSAGRQYTLSEIALVAYVTSEVTISGWTGEEPEFSSRAGPDVSVTERILSNEHPEYANWIGREYGPADVGRTFQYVEVGLIPEVFSPSQGYPRKQPEMSLRLLTSGPGYRGGVSLDRGLKINGIPLTLWGEPVESADKTGPLLSTIDPNDLVTQRLDLPNDWRSTGGAGGPRILRFGTFRIDEGQEGWFGNAFLSNGQGPLSHWYCQSPVLVEKGKKLTFTQEEPLSFVLYDRGIEGANADNAKQLFHVRIAAPGEAFEVPAPARNGGSYSGWPRRVRYAAASGSKRPSEIMEPGLDREAINGLSVSHGDYRHVALKRVVPSELFTPHPRAQKQLAAHSITWAVQGGVDIERTSSQGPETIVRSLVDGVDYAREALPDFVQDPLRRARFAPLLGENYHFPIDPTITRDFDNGLGSVTDGPYINSSDDGEDEVPGFTFFNELTPYFDLEPVNDFKFAGASPEHQFARRMAPSPVAFGSIPSAVQANAPWTCLLFRPNISDPIKHPHLGEPGNGMVWERNRTTLESLEVPQMASLTGDLYPADHLWLDYFWMPTAEPVYAASPFATQGKVNMNYQIFPYTYIKRATALHAALKGEEILAIPTEAGPTYKTSRKNPNWRHRVAASETLKQFDERFDSGEIFMTESEICEQFLIPEGQTWDGTGDSMRTFWDAHRLSGDNTLERPYAGLYSHLTTRSNAFRLHYRIQTITKGDRSAPNQFDPANDTIAEDHQGSKVLERVLDSRHPDLPDYQGLRFDLADRPRLERFYQVIVHDQ
ncbi:MAG: hypothetical protein ACI9DF_000194 [Verrucomicrobiales bacterium]|jgi:hypothetical protein